MTSDQDETPQKKKLRVRKKEKTRQAILAAAEEFFSKKPMNEVSLEEIAEAAFVSRTTLYNYFKNKDAIFFGLGIQMFDDANTRYEEIYPNDLPGIDQALDLFKIVLTVGQEKPLIYSIIREFFKRINYHKISLKEMYVKITKSMGTPKFEKLLENFEEPYLIEFAVQLLRNTEVWIKVIKKGKSDGTITNDLEDAQIAQFIHMLSSGMEEEMKIRRATLDRIRFANSSINENILKLVASFLQET